MTIADLINILEEFDPSSQIRMAHQPAWPLEATIGFVKQDPETETVYICEHPDHSDGYAPDCIYDEENE